MTRTKDKSPMQDELTVAQAAASLLSKGKKPPATVTNEALADHHLDAPGPGVVTDWRHIANGREIPTESYCDQPYLVKADDGAWLCVLTTGRGHEGQRGQHVVSLRSTDQGRTWSAPVAVEPDDGPEASYAVLLKAPTGRIYCFYNHNTDNVPKVRADNPPYEDGYCYRVDSLGRYVFKYSDDHGHTWSPQRYDVPVREMAIDRDNAYGGDLRFFWNVGRPFIKGSAAYMSLHKVGGFGEGFFTSSEGVLIKSDNILSESDPTALRWQTLPDGDYGLRTPPGGGPVAEEHSYSLLSDGSFFCAYRSIDGHPVCAYSRDDGHTWTTPQYLCYEQGRRVKHPRAANFAWRCRNGRYLYWFHNHGGNNYEDRNPVWVSAGREVDGDDGPVIAWSEPEILLYDDDPLVRMSYPDFLEEDGRYYISETQKDRARLHEIDASLLEALFNQHENASVTTAGLVFSHDRVDGQGATLTMPALPMFSERDPRQPDYRGIDLRRGFALDFWMNLMSLQPGQRLLDSQTEDGAGIVVTTAERNALSITIGDGQTQALCRSDPQSLRSDGWHHVVINVDGGPKIITFVIDGVLCDGGEHRQFGWGRFSPYLRHGNGRDALAVLPGGGGVIKSLRIYDRHLYTSEAVGHYRAGRG